jgi:hypothetical protein
MPDILDELTQESPDPAEEQNNQETTPEESQSQETETTGEQSEEVTEQQEQTPEDKSAAYWQEKFRQEREKNREKEAQQALGGKSNEQQQTATENEDQDLNVEQIIRRAVREEVTSITQREKQEAQVKAAAGELEEWAKKNDLEDIMPDIYSEAAGMNLPVSQKVRVIKAMAREASALIALKEAEKAGERKADARHKTKTSMTQTKPSATPPNNAEKTEEEKELDAALAVEGITPESQDLLSELNK